MSSGGSNRVEEPAANTDFTFDVFVCVTILVQYRDEIFSCEDPAAVFQLFAR